MQSKQQQQQQLPYYSRRFRGATIDLQSAPLRGIQRGSRDTLNQNKQPLHGPYASKRVHGGCKKLGGKVDVRREIMKAERGSLEVQNVLQICAR